MTCCLSAPKITAPEIFRFNVAYIICRDSHENIQLQQRTYSTICRPRKLKCLKSEVIVNNIEIDEALSNEHNAVVPTGDDREGGLRAWLCVAGSFLVYFASFSIMNSFGFSQSFYQLDYLSDYLPSEIAFIGTLQTALIYLTGSFAGALFDVYGLKVSFPIIWPHLLTSSVVSISIRRVRWSCISRCTFLHQSTPHMAAISCAITVFRCHSRLWSAACSHCRWPIL